MNTGVCQDLINRLRDLHPPALHVGSMALARPPAQYSFDDLHVLIHEDSLAGFRLAMEGGQRFRLVEWNPGTTGASFAGPALITDSLDHHPLPLTPYLGYSDAQSAPCTLWVQFYTNWRHGPLLLVDLEDWFGLAEVIQVPGLQGDIHRPPLWALLLWQASQVTNCAADRAAPQVIEYELDKLRRIAGPLSANDWDTASARAREYDAEYRMRLERSRPRIQAYAAPHGPGHEARLIASPPHAPNVADADLDYGVLHDLRHALEALEAYYPHTVPPRVIAALGQDTGARPRKLWHYPAALGSTGELGIAHFGIRAQVQQYAALTWQQLIAQNLVSVGIQGAPAQGYWRGLTPAQLRHIFS